MKGTYVINYQGILEKFREYTKEGTSINCIDVLQSQLEEAKTYLTGKVNDVDEDLGKVLIRTLSKDLSRYYNSFEKYQKTLGEMNSGNLSYLRHKIITSDRNFFRDTWKEDSDNFFRTRKFISIYLKDLPLSSKLNASLDCIVTSLSRYIYRKYERGKS